MFFDANQAIARELSPSERLLWSGKPPEGVRFRRGDLLVIPFSLLFALSFAFEILMTLRGTGLGISMCTVLMGLMCVYLLVGRFFVDSWARSQTAYGLSDRRVLVVARTLLSGREVKSMPLTTLSDVTLSGERNGHGTILLGPEMGGRFPGWLQRVTATGFVPPNPPAFEGIPNARRVYDMIRDAQINAIEGNARRDSRSV